MRAVLEGLHWALSAFAFTQSSDETFAALRGASPTLARFERAVDLLVYLFSADGDLDEKDRIYAELIAAYRNGGPAQALAFGVLWGGLSPAIDRIYRKHERYVGADRGELPQEIYVAFIGVIGRLEPTRVRFVAASITRNVDRVITQRRRRLHREILPDDEAEEAELFIDELRARPDRFALSRELFEMLGEDETLVMAVVVGGHSIWEVAVELGLTKAAATKRLRRALKRLAVLLSGKEMNEPVSR